ncbi:hypothetical protein KAR91_15690 [Candidatus Pacearchaeota archaeon]|nr:hypothetical protein [Candidatus Pacearchaeota archaeon]
MSEDYKEYKLPQEMNEKVEPDEMKGEYSCKKCKGWGYINQDVKPLGGLTSSPLNICPDCRGGCVIDWAKRPSQN